MAKRVVELFVSPISLAALLLLLLRLVDPSTASPGDRDPIYRDCLDHCQRSGCVDGDNCFSSCKNGTLDAKQLGLFDSLRTIGNWDCLNECRYQCMVKRESERSLAGQEPIKYHGKWPFQRLYGVQEPASVAFSLLNLFAHVWGLSSFWRTTYHKLPTKTQGGHGPYYEFCGVWIMYALFSINGWLWSAVFHTRDIPVTEKLDYSSANALLGYSLIVALFRVFNVRNEELRVMISAPIVGFVATHICFLNFYELDYGWNIKVGVTIGAVQLLLWFFWALFSRHPSRLKVCLAVLGTFAAILLEVFDFPPLLGHFDAHSLWHLVTVPLTCLWWSFIKDDAMVRTTSILRARKAE